MGTAMWLDGSVAPGAARCGPGRPAAQLSMAGTAVVIATLSMIVLTALASWTEIVGIAALVGVIVTAYGLQVWRRAPQPDYGQV